MQKFQDLLTEAAQLKEEQLKQQRKNFQALPQYLKSGLNYAKVYIQLRKQDYLVQKYVCQKIKAAGNFQYQLENYNEALTKYQQALSIFRFIRAKKYQNLKDEDIVYESIDQEKIPKQLKEEHNSLLVALYLNICSVLTKLNKKQQALHATQQALKLKTTAKLYYKKAQVYLKYINKDISDIKLGFYYLNKAYELSQDKAIITQMHNVKKSIDQQREKQKQCFKFMFGKNKSEKIENKITSKQQISQISAQQNRTNNKVQINKDSTMSQQNSQHRQSRSNEDVLDFVTQAKLASQRQSNQSNINLISQRQKKYKQQIKILSKSETKYLNQHKEKMSQKDKLEKTKEQLKKYLKMPKNSWLTFYQQDFIHKHGSKIYSTLQLYNYQQYLLQFKALLAKCLEIRQKRLQSQNNLEGDQALQYPKMIQWLKMHPVEKYKKYIQRYDLQVNWIEQNIGKQFSKQFETNPSQSNKYSSSSYDNKINTNHKSVSRRDKKDYNLLTNKDVDHTSYQRKQKTKYSVHNFKQQWQLEQDRKQQSSSNNIDENQEDQVSEKVKEYLDNYQGLSNKKSSIYDKNENIHKKKQLKQNDISPQQATQIIKQNPFGYIKTLLIVVGVSILLKLIF